MRKKLSNTGVFTLSLALALGGYGVLLGNIILLPLTYRFGYEKAKYVYYLCIGMLGGLMGITVSSGGILLNSILPANGSLLVLVVVLATVLALYALSWRLSVAWYGKAEQ